MKFTAFFSESGRAEKSQRAPAMPNATAKNVFVKISNIRFKNL
jgi:hypothetical protein